MSTPEDTSTAARRCQGQPVYDRGPARQAAFEAAAARLPWDYADYYGLMPGDQEVVASVRASMSIPFFFVPVCCDSHTAEVQLPDGGRISWPGGAVTCVDGGMLANFPIGAFDRVDDKPPRWPTIGIGLSAEPGPQAADKRVRHTVTEGLRCLQTMMGEWDRYYVDQDAADRTIFVSNGGISATQFDLSLKQQEALFRSGAEAATAFIVKHAAVGHLPRGR